jgi:DUF4097 and DUF4098 domain-containing protein YvlB
MRHNSVVLACLVLGSLPGVLAAGEEVDERLTLPVGSVVHVYCTRGDLEIVGWDRPEARIAGELDDLATGLELEVGESVTTIRVRTPERGMNRGDGSELKLWLPLATPLKVDVVSADVKVQGMTGRLAVRTVNGDVRLRDGGSNIQVSTTSGDVDLDGGSGRVRIATTSGDASVRMAATHVQVDSISGDVELELGAFDSVTANAVNADLEISGTLNRGGEISSTSVSSEVEIALAEPVNAELDIHAGPGGEIDNDLSDARPETLISRDVSLQTTLGDGSGRVRVRTVSGEIRLQPL